MCRSLCKLENWWSKANEAGLSPAACLITSVEDVGNLREQNDTGPNRIRSVPSIATPSVPRRGSTKPGPDSAGAGAGDDTPLAIPDAEGEAVAAAVRVGVVDTDEEGLGVAGLGGVDGAPKDPPRENLVGPMR